MAGNVRCHCHFPRRVLITTDTLASLQAVWAQLLRAFVAGAGELKQNALGLSVHLRGLAPGCPCPQQHIKRVIEQPSGHLLQLNDKL